MDEKQEEGSQASSCQQEQQQEQEQHQHYSRSQSQSQQPQPRQEGHGAQQEHEPTIGELADEPGLPGLPRLNYNLWHHKKKLSIVTFLLVLECSILPISLFYGLWYGTSLYHGALFAIITSFFGLITGVEFALRSWRLLHKNDTWRPIGGGRWRLDFTHWTLSFGYTVMTGILIGASIPHEPLVRPLAMPLSLFCIQLALQLLGTGYMHRKKYPAPFRISSIPKGHRMPPLVYTLVEDIVAVDGGAGKSYRQRLAARYEASPMFRLLITQLNWFWGVGSLINGVGTLAVVFTVPKAVAYGVGWGSSLIFVCIWSALTLHWIHRSLAIEKKMWLAAGRRY